MKTLKTSFKILIALVVLVAVGLFVVQNWGWVFSKRVSGVILHADRVTESTAILSPRTTEAQLHTYSILIQGEDGKLYTASAVDPQWQDKKGYCVEALLYRYPPWRLSLANTFYNARLLQLSVCAPKANGEATPGLPSTSNPSPTAEPSLTPPGDAGAGPNAK